MTVKKCRISSCVQLCHQAMIWSCARCFNMKRKHIRMSFTSAGCNFSILIRACVPLTDLQK